MLRRILLREKSRICCWSGSFWALFAGAIGLFESPRIAQELGTSQAPVREALRDLTQLRLVETVPFRGARVREIPLDEILERLSVRSALEELAVRRTAARRLGGNVSSSSESSSRCRRRRRWASLSSVRS